MKSLYGVFICVFLLFFLGCKNNKKPETVEVNKELSVLEKVAYAHGFENWSKVNRIDFTFNIDRDSTHFERSWIWKPKTNQITRISGGDTLTYRRKSMDSIAYKTNAGFINDRYWLLAPFNLIWDHNNFEYTHSIDQIAPIAQKKMHKLTIVYSNEGGYTPGDAYDFYFKDDYLIQEWAFRKANQQEPSMLTTWENYVNHNGFKLAMDHKKPEENFNLFFDRVTTIME